MFSLLDSLRRRIVLSFLFLIVFLTVIFHLFATELLIIVAGVWRFYIIIEFLQGSKSWQISVAIIVLSVFFPYLAKCGEDMDKRYRNRDEFSTPFRTRYPLH